MRTRNPALIDTSDIVVDVGAIYDPARHRYDHHQRCVLSPDRCSPNVPREFTETMNSLDSKKKWTTKLSSAGLVYFHFGREVWRQSTCRMVTPR